jgi:hypothetical protein
MTQTLKELLQKTQDQAVEQSAANVGSVSAGRSPATIRPRSFASPQDVYDTDVGYESPFLNFSPGSRRAMWSLPDVALTHTPVATLTSSATPGGTQATQVTGAGAQSGVLASNVWSTVPNMELSLVVNGPVNMSASIPVQSTSPSDPVRFAFYRNGQLLSQQFLETTHVNSNTPTITTISFTDPSPLSHSPLNLETYSVYWNGPSGNVSSPGVGRSFFLQSLIPH